MKVAKIRYLGIITSLVTFTSLFLPWWSIRASGVSIDVYPFRVMAWTVPSYDADWVVGRLLALDSTLITVGLLVVVSTIMATVGSLKLPPLLIAPVVLNLAAAFLFYRLMYSAIGKLAFGSFSGTNLIAVGPWGFAIGIGFCVLAGLASPASFILYYLNYRKPEQKGRSGKSDRSIRSTVSSVYQIRFRYRYHCASGMRSILLYKAKRLSLLVLLLLALLSHSLQ